MKSILLVDKNKIVRENLRELLDADDRFQVIGESNNDVLALELLERYKPDLLIIDTSICNQSAIKTAKQIKQLSPKTKIITLSLHDDKIIIQRLFKAGIVGYLLKECAYEELPHALTAVYNDQDYLCSRLQSLNQQRES